MGRGNVKIGSRKEESGLRSRGGASSVLHTTSPKVSVVIPVYNVEPYLRQCLDSVVNQTLRDIQIICVNDGSTDASPAVLEEYAAKDSRIEVYHQENQGGGSARNAAYPHICGKYTYFVDPDDWIELDLCQQCWDKAETTEADAVVMRFIRHNPKPECYLSPYKRTLPEVRQTVAEKHELFRLSAPWMGFWKSELLLSNNVWFPKGKRPFNDMLPYWKGIVLAERIAVLNSPLYHYRIRPGSYQQTIDEKHFIIVETFEEIGKMLRETGYYESYKDFYIQRKLAAYYSRYHMFPHSLRSKFRQHICEHMTTADRNAWPSHSCKDVRNFYLFLGDDGRLGTLKYHLQKCLSDTIKLPERLLRRHVIKPLRTFLDTKRGSVPTSESATEASKKIRFHFTES